MYPSSLPSEMQAAHRALAHLIYLTFSLPEALYTHRVLRRLRPLLRQYPSTPCPFLYRTYTFAVEKETRKVRTWYLNGALGPREWAELPVTGVGGRQGEEWRQFLAEQALARRIVTEDCQRGKEK